MRNRFTSLTTSADAWLSRESDSGEDSSVRWGPSSRPTLVCAGIASSSPPSTMAASCAALVAPVQGSRAESESFGWRERTLEWGVARIGGALYDLGIELGRNTIKRILLDSGLLPSNRLDGELTVLDANRRAAEINPLDSWVPSESAFSARRTAKSWRRLLHCRICSSLIDS